MISRIGKEDEEKVEIGKEEEEKEDEKENEEYIIRHFNSPGNRPRKQVDIFTHKKNVCIGLSHFNIPSFLGEIQFSFFVSIR